MFIYYLMNSALAARRDRQGGKEFLNGLTAKLINHKQSRQTSSPRQTDKQTDGRTDSAIKWGCNTAAAAATRLDRINQFMQALKTRIKMLKQNQNQRNPQ